MNWHWRRNPHVYPDDSEVIRERVSSEDGRPEAVYGWRCLRCGDVWVPTDFFDTFLPPTRYGCAARPLPGSPPQPDAHDLPIPSEDARR
jgi:hypothetical protein